MKRPIVIKLISPGDARGWIGLGCFILAVFVLVLAASDKTLLDNNAFLVLATAIIITGWVNGPVGWAYQATKSGGEAAESSARIAEAAANAALPVTVSGDDANKAATLVADAALDKAQEIKGKP